MRATKLVYSVEHSSYEDRLRTPSLNYRRIRGDLIEVYKVTTMLTGMLLNTAPAGAAHTRQTRLCLTSGVGMSLTLVHTPETLQA